jgi:hypothetical protein
VPGVELPLASEVRGKKRQNEQTGVPRQPGWLLVWEPGSEACHLDRDGRSHGEDERLEPAAQRASRLLVTAHEKLFPESAAVLACELSGQGVDVPQPFHGDQESLIGCEAGCVQLGDLVTKMILQLIDVVAVDPRGACDVGAPLCDL